ncbi:MAG TPA: hypothetical protein VFC44_09145 [Candidatus Saccharimonadales bacterium]|nr:hypothetical protein [Candidatus Saccharimonadales bacterium]
MKEALAEKLLAKVLGWEPPEMAKERPRLQAMASFKYDAYEQFSPGLRFVESLALWLNQFEAAHRKTAYDYLMSALVFCSAEEMDHLVETAYHGRTIAVPRKTYRIQWPDGVVIQDRGDGGTVTEPNVVQQSGAVIKNRTHRSAPSFGDFSRENLVFIRRSKTPGRVAQQLNDWS